GEEDAPKFKDYLLPLLFLKRLSDVFDDEIERLAEDYGDEGVARELAESDHELLRFYLPPEARWGVVSGREAYDWPTDAEGRRTTPADMGEHLTKAVRAVVRENPTLSGVVDLVDFASERNGERDFNPAKLAAVVETFSDPRYRLGLADVQPDFLGRAYEYLLRKFAEGSGQSAGEFFTPTEVGFLMANILRPKPGESCHDFACGSAGLLIKLQLVARRRDPTSRLPLRLSGQELQAESYAVARMNGIIHDMELEIRRGDTMLNPKFKTGGGEIQIHDVVIANPMWNQPFGPNVFSDDPFDRFRPRGGVTTGKGDWAWLQHAKACLNARGRAAIVLDTGAVTRGSGSKHEDRERNIRKWFVENDLVDGVILLPDNLFYNTTAPGVIVVLARSKAAARRGKIVLLNASRRVKKGRPKNYIPEEDIAPLAEAYLKGEPVAGEIAVITKEQATEADYNLSPNRWVSQADAAVERPITEIVAELRQLDEQEREIDASLGKIAADDDVADESDSVGLQENDASLERMLKLFTRGLRGEPQRETEVGPLPRSWELVPVGKVFDIEQGVSLKGNLTSDEDGTPFLRTSNVYWGRVALDTVSRLHLSRPVAVSKWLRAGDLLVCEGGEIGRAAVWDGQIAPCLFQNHLHRLRPKRGGRVAPAFAAAWLREGFVHRSAYEGVGNRTTIPNLSRGRLAEMRIPRPSPDEQREIVAVLDTLDQKADLHRRKSAVLDDVFKTVLHKLMTGEIRVADLGPPEDLESVAS
ncbi:MAG: N-6 DNA methylase, partial [Rhodospirillaceae bacterium]|nr:N-6 DNA methylase [Rhodospirillaceae bacterium]